MRPVAHLLQSPSGCLPRVRMTWRGVTLAVLAAMVLAGCGGGSVDEPANPARPTPSAAPAQPLNTTGPQGTVTLFRYAGSLQCEGGGTSLLTLERQLSNAGVMALTLACGHDGRYYPSTCGTPDGRILVAEVNAAQADAARAAGLQSMAVLVSAVRTACD